MEKEGKKLSINVLCSTVYRRKMPSSDIRPYTDFSWMHMTAFSPVKNKSLFVLHKLQSFYVNKSNSDLFLYLLFLDLPQLVGTNMNCFPLLTVRNGSLVRMHFIEQKSTSLTRMLSDLIIS